MASDSHALNEPFDNGGERPLHVPGIGCPVDFQFDKDSRFMHGYHEWSQDPRLTAREVAMLQVMDALTDKPDWSRKVFNDEIVGKWHAEALTMPLINEPTWMWILAELRDKATAFERNGFVLAYDTGSRCAKSDTLISDDLRAQLIAATQPLLRRPEKDWHPNSDEQVLNLVHPSLFPLVYGKTRVLSTGQVGLENCIESCGTGDLLPAPNMMPEDYRPGYFPRNITDRWSARFQWLPCEVKFTEPQGTDVSITSYINNLHPTYHQSLYIIIEKLISKAIPLWNMTLLGPEQYCGFGGHSPPRITTTEARTDPPEPKWIWELERDPKSEGYRESVKRVEEFLAMPDPPGLPTDRENQSYQNGSWLEERDLYGAVEWKYRRIRKVQHPDPGVTVSVHKPYPLKLEKDFRPKGLQVIVKPASIELTPDKPTYPGGDWHLEGMLNEHIVATAIYYYDVDNTTESRIRFRQEAGLDSTDMTYEQDDHGPLAEIFGVENGSLSYQPAVQELGSIATPQGRLLAFPNTLQHKVSPFQLADPQRPGHRRFLVLWLVDPHYRIASTANVPPQQHEWWEPHALRRVLDRSGLPPELCDLVREATGEWPMGLKEAKEVRLELMNERTKLMPAVEGAFEMYNFCEH